MKKQLLLITLALFSINAVAQSYQWAKSMGGQYDDIGYSIAIDANGNVYTTGYFGGTADFDPGPGTYTLTATGIKNIFISKLDANGNFVWAKCIAQGAGGLGLSLTVDASGNVYTTGYFEGTGDFDPGNETYLLTADGNFSNAFISKLDANGNFVWAKNIQALNSFSWVGGFSIAIGANGNVYLTGYYFGQVDFDPGNGVYNLPNSYFDNAFILKLDVDGNFVWAKEVTSNNVALGNSIALDAFENVYITGLFEGKITINLSQGNNKTLTSAGHNDIFISKLDASGNFMWAKSMGGIGYDSGESIAVSSGNVYITGSFNGTVDFDPGAGIHTLVSSGPEDIFISKLDGNGNFVWTKSTRGTGYDYGTSIAIDASGNVYTTGRFRGSVDFDPGNKAYNFASSDTSSFDGFILKLDASGNFIWAKSFGGSGDDYGESIIVPHGNIYVIGSFKEKINFNPDAVTDSLVSSGGDDIFVLKLEDPLTAIIPENINEKGIAIYPNPANDIINIQASGISADIDYTISDIMGTTILSGRLNNKTTSVNIGGLTAGLYFVQIDGEIRYKVMKH